MNKKKVLILFAGRAGTQVEDILFHYEDIEVIGFLDDGKKIGEKVLDKKVIGKLEILEELFNKKEFDAAVISIGDNKIRKMAYEKCKKIGIPLVNVIDPTAQINKNVKIGEGNVICGHVYIGNSSLLGDNNFISSNTSIEHHNIWGSHITTGPHVSTTGACKIGDNVKIGMHVGIQFANIGKNSFINSGIVITKDIPENSIVKKKNDYVVIQS